MARITLPLDVDNGDTYFMMLSDRIEEFTLVKTFDTECEIIPKQLKHPGYKWNFLPKFIS